MSKGEHHTFAVEQSTSITITKQHWPAYIKAKLEDATKRSSRVILLCVFDREQATIAKATEAGYTILSTLRGNMPKKTDVSHVSSNFYREIIQALNEYMKRERPSGLLIGGASFWHTYIKKEIEAIDLQGLPVVYSNTNDVGEHGIDELVKRPELKQLLSHVRYAREMEQADKLLVQLQKDASFVRYSMGDCSEAAKAGSIQTLLVTEQFIADRRLNDEVKEVEDLMLLVEQTGGIVHILGNHEGSRKIDGLGGVAAILRYGGV